MSQLQIIDQTENEKKDSFSKKELWEKAVQSHCERLWLTQSKKIDPQYYALGRERIKRTWNLICEYIPELSHKKCVDLGCGAGDLALFLKQKEALITAMDVASNALKKVKEKDNTIEVVKGCLPNSKFLDASFDLVIATDVIGELEEVYHRLFISELTRIVKREGLVVCSTPLEIGSIDVLEKFTALCKTELEILEWRMSYHRLYLFWIKFWNFPHKMITCILDPEYRRKQLSKRKGFNRILFKIFSKNFLNPFWKLVNIVYDPILEFVRANSRILLLSEKISKLLWAENGATHAIFIGRRK